MPDGSLALSDRLRWTKPGIGDFTERRIPGRIDAEPGVVQLPKARIPAGATESAPQNAERAPRPANSLRDPLNHSYCQSDTQLTFPVSELVWRCWPAGHGAAWPC